MIRSPTLLFWLTAGWIVINETNMAQKLYMLISVPGSAIPEYVTTVDGSGKSIFSNGVPQPRGTTPSVNIVSGGEITDRLLTSGNELILSSKASSVLSRHRIDPQIVRTGVKLKSRDIELSSWPSFELWYSRGHHSVLHSAARTRKFKGHVLSVFEWVLASASIPPFDFFLAPTNCWFATESLIDSVFDAGLTGFGFAAIPALLESANIHED